MEQSDYQSKKKRYLQLQFYFLRWAIPLKLSLLLYFIVFLFFSAVLAL